MDCVSGSGQWVLGLKSRWYHVDDTKRKSLNRIESREQAYAINITREKQQWGDQPSKKLGKNLSMVFWTPDESVSSKKRVCRAGKTSVTLLPTSSCRVGAIHGMNPRDIRRSFTAVNRCKSSSHWPVSMSSCQDGEECVEFRM